MWFIVSIVLYVLGGLLMYVMSLVENNTKTASVLFATFWPVVVIVCMFTLLLEAISDNL